ncbi:hypothetical protein [Neoroseomonas lacus]|uniref:DUF669 domain-containing protein n=1 Tax=Neoroseomonas lacus TaxID=287609 RepID=A0A917KCI0_9PROT|nr:hypothetical protein [Neoroseomonas lacus]GGJ07265.1 hypothetical protein GCM10011320_12720 [Neoroseomonas lacus]
MTYDMNDAELPRGSDLIPDGSFVKVTMHLRKGGLDGQGEADRGLLKATKTPGSDVKMLDCEFTVTAGPHIRRKFWQTFTVIGGKVDEQGVSIGWKISKGVFRAMIDSALGLDSQDMSEAAKARRMLRGLSDLHGITFAAKVRVEPASDPRYSDSNRLDRVVLPGEPEYARVMAGEAVPAQPSNRSARPPAATATTPPAWAAPGAATPSAAAPRMWERPAATSPAPVAPQPAEPSLTAPAMGGPAWLNG